MAKARALYICPIGAAAIVAAAPVIAAGRDYEVVRALLLRGIENEAAPTDTEQSNVIRPERGIMEFLRRRGIDFTSITLPPFDSARWRGRIAAEFAQARLDGIDMVVVNGLSGTKQMSYGAWDGLTGWAATRSNLATRKCFVASGAIARVQIDDGGPRIALSEIEPLTLPHYLELYGFQEHLAGEAAAEREWFWQHRVQIGLLWDGAIAGQWRRVRTRAEALAGGAGACQRLSDPDKWQASLWLEAGLYIRLRGRAEGASVPAEPVSSLSLVDWAARGEQPLAPNQMPANDYELDAAVLTGGVLHLFECKNVNPITKEQKKEYVNAIYKQATLRERLQGRAGTNAIVTRYPPKEESPLWFKARAAAVRMIHPASAELNQCLDRIFGKPPPPGAA